MPELYPYATTYKKVL